MNRYNACMTIVQNNELLFILNDGLAVEHPNKD